jgi:hypothetical protein
MQQHFIFDFDTDQRADDWRLDEDTKATGRRGIQLARQTLASAA